MSNRALTDLAGSTGLIALVLVAFLIWLLIKTFELVVRMLARHPRHLLLWAGFLGLVLGPVVAWQQPALRIQLGVLAGVSGVVLISTAKVLEIVDDQLFFAPVSPRLVAASITHDTWWNAA